MKVIEVSTVMLEKAEQLAEQQGILPKSITNGEGNVAGFVGELVFSQWSGAVIARTRHWDCVLNGITYDVKTQRCTSVPLPHYEVNVSHATAIQLCDRYVFCRFHEEAMLCYILGWKDRQRYFWEATFRKEGEKRKPDGFRYTSDCWVMNIHNLNPYIEAPG